jgi:hypothetical protein
VIQFNCIAVSEVIQINTDLMTLKCQLQLGLVVDSIGWYNPNLEDVHHFFGRCFHMPITFDSTAFEYSNAEGSGLDFI